MIERQFREENIIFIKIQNDGIPRNECKQFMILFLTINHFDLHSSRGICYATSLC